MLPKYRAAASVAPEQGGPDAFALLSAAAHVAATSPWSAHADPTEAQALANAYKVGRMVWHGLPIRIENPAHSIREGTDPDGKPWRNMMQAAYGDFAGTKGADGDPVDLFMGPFPESRKVWVLNQRTAAGAFDEHKVLLGFPDEAAALSAYRYSYSPGWDRGGPAIRITLDQLKWWLKWADTTKPMSLDTIPPEPEMIAEDTLTPAAPDLTRVFWDDAANPMGKTLGEVLYLCRANDGAEGLILDPMSMSDLMEGQEVLRMDALMVLVGKLEPQMRAMMRVMEAAGADVKPLSFQISEPVRRHGGVHVATIFELSDGQTITVWFHNPDMTPAKLSPADTLVSWKWLLNKKDITIVVAPESGSDLNAREVGRRLMRLAAKNSAAFARANAKRAAVMGEIEGLKSTLAAKQGELQGLLGQIEVAKVAKADRQELRGGSEDPTAGEWVASFEGNTRSGLYFSDVGQARDYIDAKYEQGGGRLYWVQHLNSTEFRLPFAAMTAIKKNDGTRNPGSEEEIRPWFDKALRFANKEVGQYGADWMRKNLALLLSFFSGVSLAWCQRYVESKFPVAQEPAATDPVEAARTLQGKMNRRAAQINALWEAEFPSLDKSFLSRKAVGEVGIFYSAGDISAQITLRLDLLPFSRWTVKSVNTVGVTVSDDGAKPVQEVADEIVAAIKADAAYVAPASPADPAGSGEMRRWLVTNTQGYSKVHEASTMVRAIQAGMAEVDYTIPSSRWQAVPAQADTADPAQEAQLAAEDAMWSEEAWNGELVTVLRGRGIDPFAFTHDNATELVALHQEGKTPSEAVDALLATAAASVDQTPAQRVDAAFSFNASDEFKEWLAESLDRAEYSPFATAKAMTQRARAQGADIEWGFFGGATMDSAAEVFKPGDVVLMKVSDGVKTYPMTVNAVLDGAVECVWFHPASGEPRRSKVDPGLIRLLDKATGTINVFQSGDKVVGLDDNKDYTVTGQIGYQVSVKGEKKAIHANRLRLASGAKPRRVKLDGAQAAFALRAGNLHGIIKQAAEVAAGKQGAAVSLDSVSGAITTLEIALDVVTTNEPINRAAGKEDQAELEAKMAGEFRRALALLKGAAMDSADPVDDPEDDDEFEGQDDDFDAEAEWAAMPEDEEEEEGAAA